MVAWGEKIMDRKYGLRAALFVACATAALVPGTSVGAQPVGGATAEQRAADAASKMTLDEKLTLVFGYFASDWQGKKPPAEGRYGSAGYVPGIPRLGITPEWETDAGVGVATQGAATVKRERTALPSGIATAATWNPELAF
jgi:beta-glucosidase